MSTYIAEFGAESGGFYATALTWPAPIGALLPPGWWGILRSRGGIDCSLRGIAGSAPCAVLILTADRPEPLSSAVAALVSASPPAGLRGALNGADFDAMTDPGGLEAQLRVRHDGFHRDGQPLGCDFRLYSYWPGQDSPGSTAYQITLRALPATLEQERRVRKYLAWLEIETPFTPAVRELQSELARRLLAPSWLADEYLLFPDPGQRAAAELRVREHFIETSGRLGFPAPPVEAGDFSDWLTTGCHTVRERAVPPSPPIEGACAFSEDEVLFVARQCLAAGGPKPPVAEPEVFISYASADFLQADAARRHLEDRGLRCWIAPRDINLQGLSYSEAIPLAIRQVRVVLVLLSSAANLSVHIPRELDLALERRLPLIPLRLADIEPAGQLKYLLQTCQWLDMFDRDHAEAMTELDLRLRGVLGS